MEVLLEAGGPVESVDEGINTFLIVLRHATKDMSREYLRATTSSDTSNFSWMFSLFCTLRGRLSPEPTQGTKEAWVNGWKDNRVPVQLGRERIEGKDVGYWMLDVGIEGGCAVVGDYSAEEDGLGVEGGGIADDDGAWG